MVNGKWKGARRTWACDDGIGDGATTIMGRGQDGRGRVMMGSVTERPGA